jgi:hypothetical protein
MADLWERRRIQRERHQEGRLREFRLRECIQLEHRPTFGTDGMWRSQSCVKLAVFAMLTGHLPRGSVVVIADGRYTLPANPAWEMYTRRSWVDLPDGQSWEPVEATLLPSERHYELSAPRAMWRYPSKAKLRAAIRRADRLPVTQGEGWIHALAWKLDYLEPLAAPLGLSVGEFVVRLNRMINGGVPDGGLELGE